jgi:hypothetical protein
MLAKTGADGLNAEESSTNTAGCVAPHTRRLQNRFLLIPVVAQLDGQYCVLSRNDKDSDNDFDTLAHETRKRILLHKILRKESPQVEGNKVLRKSVDKFAHKPDANAGQVEGSAR